MLGWSAAAWGCFPSIDRKTFWLWKTNEPLIKNCNVNRNSEKKQNYTCGDLKWMIQTDFDDRRSFSIFRWYPGEGTFTFDD